MTFLSNYNVEITMKRILKFLVKNLYSNLANLSSVYSWLTPGWSGLKGNLDGAHEVNGSRSAGTLGCCSTWVEAYDFEVVGES